MTWGSIHRAPTDPLGERLAADFDSLGRLVHMENGPGRRQPNDDTIPS